MEGRGQTPKKRGQLGSFCHVTEVLDQFHEPLARPTTRVVCDRVSPTMVSGDCLALVILHLTFGGPARDR